MTDMRLNGSPVPARDQEAGPRPRVAVLGTGTMGSAMARNLLRAGVGVDVWNRTPEPAARLTEAGATAHRGRSQSRMPSAAGGTTWSTKASATRT